MSRIGTVDSLWRYPVKSMRGEELQEAFLGFAGVYGDRIFAIRSSTSLKAFPYLTAREQRRMLQYRPTFRHPDNAMRPLNVTEAQSLGPGVTPVYGNETELMVDVIAPNGMTMAINDPELLRQLADGLNGTPELHLLRSDRAMTDCRPVSLLSVQSVRQLSEEIGSDVNPLCFRANIYLNLEASPGFAEDQFVGRSARIGKKAVISILERDSRCALISLDPETGESQPKTLKQVAQGHEGMTGVYAAVLVEGIVYKGDQVELLD